MDLFNGTLPKSTMNPNGRAQVHQFFNISRSFGFGLSLCGLEEQQNLLVRTTAPVTCAECKIVAKQLPAKMSRENVAETLGGLPLLERWFNSVQKELPKFQFIENSLPYYTFRQVITNEFKGKRVIALVGKEGRYLIADKLSTDVSIDVKQQPLVRLFGRIITFSLARLLDRVVAVVQSQDLFPNDRGFYAYTLLTEFVDTWTTDIRPPRMRAPEVAEVLCDVILQQMATDQRQAIEEALR